MTTKLTEEYLKDMAKERGGEYIDEGKYNGHMKKVKWKCGMGHIWEASPHYIRNRKVDSWCPICSRQKPPKKRAPKRKISIDTAREYALSKEGKCLSSEFINVHKKLIWECKNNHIWSGSFHSVADRDTWCWKCFIKNGPGQYHVGNIEEIKKVIEERGETCLSTKYKNAYTPIEIKCQKDHIRITNAHEIQRTISQSNRLPRCNFCHKEKAEEKKKLEPPKKEYRKLTLKDACDLAKSRGGQCLSTEYKNNQEKLIWECKRKHIWHGNFANASGGKWCIKCYKIENSEKHEKNMLEIIKNIAKERGGELLSEHYKNQNTPLDFRCANGHTWTATSNHLSHFVWCPECGIGKGEKLFRNIMEHITNEKFIKVRPDWLRGNSGRKLEIDGYSENLGLAFEYQGQQHFCIVGWFQGTQKSLEKTQENDKIKKDTIEKRGIKIIFPTDRIKYNKLLDFAVKELENIGMSHVIDYERVKNFNLNEHLR